MGYRIDFGIEQGTGGRTLQARIQGRSSRLAERIGRDIAEQAKRESARQLLIDVRGLVDRLGALGTLVLAASHQQRVAVIDSGDNELFHPFSESKAQQRGYEVRFFFDAATALEWLHAEDSH
ncbi:MAG TPA: hypothetical protein VE085_09130 [Burkholderiales bacterium]|nr:hypothetical protein [Burkholderiales bacterium]